MTRQLRRWVQRILAHEHVGEDDGRSNRHGRSWRHGVVIRLPAWSVRIDAHAIGQGALARPAVMVNFMTTAAPFGPYALLRGSENFRPGQWRVSRNPWRTLTPILACKAMRSFGIRPETLPENVQRSKSSKEFRDEPTCSEVGGVPFRR